VFWILHLVDDISELHFNLDGVISNSKILDTALLVVNIPHAYVTYCSCLLCKHCTLVPPVCILYTSVTSWWHARRNFAQMLTSSPVGVRNIALSVSECQTISLSVRSNILKTARPIFTKFSLHVTCRRGSVLLWRQSDNPILCTSGFVDDVMFSYNGVVQFTRWRHRGEVYRLRLRLVNMRKLVEWATI